MINSRSFLKGFDDLHLSRDPQWQGQVQACLLPQEEIPGMWDQKRILNKWLMKLQVIHEDALSRADTTKRTVRRNYLNRWDNQFSRTGFFYRFGFGLTFFSLDRNDTEISIMESSSEVQSKVTSTSQDENMNTPDNMEMDVPDPEQKNDLSSWYVIKWFYLDYKF